MRGTETGTSGWCCCFQAMKRLYLQSYKDDVESLRPPLTALATSSEKPEALRFCWTTSIRADEETEGLSGTCLILAVSEGVESLGFPWGGEMTLSLAPETKDDLAIAELLELSHSRVFETFLERLESWLEEEMRKRSTRPNLLPLHPLQRLPGLEQDLHTEEADCLDWSQIGLTSATPTDLQSI